jgi:hypothetical protein
MITSSGVINDANYYLNGGTAVSLIDHCTDWNTQEVTCNVLTVPLIPLSWNDFNVSFDTNTGLNYNENIVNYYNPNKDFVLPGGGGNIIIILLILAGLGLIVMGFMLKR